MRSYGRARKNRANAPVPERKGANKAQVVKQIKLPDLELRMMTISLVGLSPLICNRKTERAMKAMVDKETGTATSGKAPRDLDVEYQDSLYKINGGYGFPASAFKQAAVEACTSLGRNVITKVQARQSHHVLGDFVRLKGTPEYHQEMVRLKSGGMSPRARGMFRKWGCDLTIRYNARVLSEAQLLNLYRIAGFAVGVGDGRPEKKGGRSFGMFDVR